MGRVLTPAHDFTQKAPAGAFFHALRCTITRQL